MIAKQALYRVSHTTSSLFCSGYFEDRVSDLPGLALNRFLMI
jgi:hypothetical protein